MTIHAIDAGSFKLDGGAMFGVVPKTLWTRTNPADSNNMIDIGARCMLIEEGDRLILIDTGMGDKQSEKFFSYYHPWGGATLENSLIQKGFHPDDVTDVFLTHLHFDHSGGCIKWAEDGKTPIPVFKNATYWSNKAHWEWATQNILPIEESGQLKFVERPDSAFAKTSALDFGILFVDGHTDKQMIPHISYKGKTIVFAADLLPTAGHLPLPYVMGFDTRPLLTLSEKEKFLNEAADQNYYLWLQHDAHNPVITVKHTEKGVRLNEKFNIADIL